MALSVQIARREALFASALQPGDKPTVADVKEAVAATVRTLRSRGCAERVAQEFGDHPDTALARMRWAREVVEVHYARRGAR